MRAGLIGFVVAAALGGCGGSAKKTTPAPLSGTAKVVSGKSTPERSVTVAADVTSGGGASGPDQMRITIYDLRRQGPFVVLDFSFTCERAGIGSNCGLFDSARH